MLVNLFLFLLLVCFSVFSETVIFRDGNTIKGKLKSQDANSLVINIKGKDNIVSKSKIRRVIYAITQEQEEKQVKEELIKLKIEKSKKVKKTKEEEDAENLELEVEIAKAIEEQEKQEKLNLNFQDRIKLLETDIYKLKSENNLEDSGSKLSKLEEEVRDLKKRTRRIERFLSIDPDIEEYYSKPRSLWSVIWRSTLIPGWGLNYARDSFGTMYTSLFFIGAFGYVGLNTNVNSLEQKYNDKLLNDFLIQPFILNQTITSTSSFTVSSRNDFTNLINLNQNTKLFSLYKLQRDVDDEKEAVQSIANGLAGLYVLQLLHSAVVGYFWSKQTIKKFDEDSKTSLRMNLFTDQNKNQNFQIGILSRF